MRTYNLLANRRKSAYSAAALAMRNDEEGREERFFLDVKSAAKLVAVKQTRLRAADDFTPQVQKHLVRSHVVRPELVKIY